ncbi:MAG: phage portal protein [Lachnospiraceae bacterium]|nr:phage portal protein [Lachnospiraceae bacterium]
MEAEETMELSGRKRIYTDETVIDETNILSVLNDALITHMENSNEIAYLLKYEKGYQPLKREKVIRPEIDVKVTDNVANEVTEFKLGYNWGNPIIYVQHGNNDLSGNDSGRDDNAVSMLSEMFREEGKASLDQELARYIEICGVGYRFIRIKREYDGGSVFQMAILNPMFAFVVYSNDAFRVPMMACTFRITKSGVRYYTCYTRDAVYEIRDGVTIINGVEKVDEKGKKVITNGKGGEANPLGIIPIVEYNRSHDRTGCFERQISDMDNLNILVSDFTNDVAQTTQAVWWANDIELPKDEDGKTKKVKAGQWILSKTTGAGNKPQIQALAFVYDYQGILDDIKYRRDVILQKCDVPLRSEPGGGSTGTAMSMSSGWSDADCSANKESQIIEASEIQTLRVVKKIIDLSSDIPEDSPLKKLRISDIDIKFVRNKNYDMATKANTFATYVSHGVYGRHAMQLSDMGGDIEQIWLDSKEGVEKYQESIYEKQKADSGDVGKVPYDMTASEEDKSGRLQQDESDQSENSPILSS